MRAPALARFAWLTLGYNLLVVAWGAYVRATGAGAGCGDHWPLCNGEVIPRAAETATLVEFTHRLTSGLALVLVVILLVWARRSYPAGHRVRRAAAWSTGLMIVEALIGAGLVLFQLVADDESMARAVSLALHLVNTFLLLGAIALTAWFASGKRGFRMRESGVTGGAIITAAAATVLLGASGAIIALGDTLIASALRSGQTALSPMVQLLLDIRIAHPLLAVGVSAFVAAMVMWLDARTPPETRRYGVALVALFVAQLGVGLLNVALHAPVWMQIVHLLLADLVWLSLVLYGATALAEPAVSRVESRETVGQASRPTVGATLTH